MQLSLKSVFVLVVFLSIVVALSYAAPFYIGYIALTVISLVVFPPVLITGIVYSRGSKQAFFIGCMVTGMIHYIINFYYAIIFGFGYGMMSSESENWNEIFADEGSDIGIFARSMTLIFYAVAFLGGCSSWTAYRLFHSPTTLNETDSPENNEAETQEIRRNH